MVAVEHRARFLEVIRLLGRRRPRKGHDRLEVIPRHDVLARVRVHEGELLELAFDGFLDLALELEGLDLLLELLVIGGLRVGRDAELLLDRLELLAEEILALVLLDAPVDLGLYLLLDAQELLLLLDEHEYLLHALADVLDLEDPLLVGLVDVQDARDEVRDLPGLVDIDHVEAHLLGEKGIVLRDLFHLADERARERLHLEGIGVLVLEIIDDGDHRVPFVNGLADPVSLQGRNENVDATVGKVDLLDDARDGPDLAEVRDGRLLAIHVEHRYPDKAITRVGFLDDLHVIGVIDHYGREDSGKYGTPHEGD